MCFPLLAYFFNAFIQDVLNNDIIHDKVVCELLNVCATAHFMNALQCHIFWFMNDTFCAHMLPVKRCPLFGHSGHFHVIVTHSDTLKRWTAAPRQPRGDHPLGSLVTFGQYLFILRFRWGCVGCCVRNISRNHVPFHWLNPRPWKGGYIGPCRLKSLWSCVIVGCSDARCCYSQMGRWELECPLQSLLIGTYHL